MTSSSPATAFALAAVVSRLLRHHQDDGEQTYHTLRMRTGRSILLGLEFRWLATSSAPSPCAPTFRSLGVLAGIVVIRTFLSFSLEVEISGRWPWQRPQQSQAAQLPGQPQKSDLPSEQRRAA